MKGFTLVETLVAIIVFSLALGVVTSFIILGYRNQGYAWQQALAINEARRGIETMIREIREAKTGQDGSYPIEKAEDKEFIFYSDIDKDGKSNAGMSGLGKRGDLQRCLFQFFEWYLNFFSSQGFG